VAASDHSILPGLFDVLDVRWVCHLPHQGEVFQFLHSFTGRVVTTAPPRVKVSSRRLLISWSPVVFPLQSSSSVLFHFLSRTLHSDRQQALEFVERATGSLVSFGVLLL